MDELEILVRPHWLMIYNKLTRAQALKGPAPDGGLWNGRKVADYLTELKSQPISRQLGWEYRETDANATAGAETNSL